MNGNLLFARRLAWRLAQALSHATLALAQALATVAIAPSLARADVAADASPPPELTSPAGPGDYTITVRSGGFDRVARVHIPAGYKAGSKPPLALVLHGAGGNGAGALDKNLWAAKADKEGFIAVAPEGLPAIPRWPANFRSNPSLWNSGQLKAGSQRAAIDDVAFIKQLLDQLQTSASYDGSRVFCAGHSNGGAMTFRLGAELSERLTAIGAVAGIMAVNDPQPKKPLPTLYILGDQDPLVPIAGGEVALPWGKHQNPPVFEPLAAWARAIGCESEPQTVSEKDGLKTIEFRSKSRGPTLTMILIAGHGHHWPGGKVLLPPRMIGPISNKLDATDVLWDFFKSQGSRTGP